MSKLYVKGPQGEEFTIFNGIVIGFAERQPEIAALRKTLSWRIEYNAIRSGIIENASVDDMVVALNLIEKFRTAPASFCAARLHQQEENFKFAYKVNDREHIAYEHFLCAWNDNGIPKATSGGLFMEPAYMKSLSYYLISSITRLDKSKLPSNINTQEQKTVRVPLPLSQRLYFHCQNIANGTSAVHLHNKEQLTTLCRYLNDVYHLTVDSSNLTEAEIKVFEKFCFKDGKFVKAKEADWDTFVDARELMRLIDHVNKGVGQGLAN